MTPRGPLMLLRLLLPDDLAEEMAGDLEEDYRSNRQRHGRFYSGLQYWRGVVSWDTCRLWYEIHRRPRAPVSTGGTLGVIGPSGEIRQAVRSLVRQPGFTVSVVLLFAVGIGATATVFSLVDGVVLRHLPYANPDRLVVLDKPMDGPPPISDYGDWIASSAGFEAVAASTVEPGVITGDGDPAIIPGAAVTPDFFSALGVHARLGRLFQPDDYHSPAGVVVLSYGIWQQRWGSDPSIIGRSFTLNEQPVTVIGVLPVDFLPVEVLGQAGAEIWSPIQHDCLLPWTCSRRVLGKLRSGVSLAAAQAEMNALGLSTNQESSATGGKDRRPGIVVGSLHDATVGDVRSSLFMVFGAVVLLLLLATANVAAMFLVRETDRTREMAIRAALGAGRGRLVGQLVTEGMLVAIVGGLLGLLIANYGVGMFRILDPGHLPRQAWVSANWRVALFSLGLSVAIGIMFAVIPAIRSTRVRLAETLKAGGRTGTRGRRQLTPIDMIVTGEIALALILLVGAGLLVNSFVRLRRVDPGFIPSQVATFELHLDSRYRSPENRAEFARRLLDRLEALPGVTAAGAAHRMPMGPGIGWIPAIKDVGGSPGDRGVRALARTVTPGFFEALGVPILEGRSITWDDDESHPPVAVISTSLAESLWPGQSPIGRTIMNPENEAGGSVTIVGMVGDVKYQGLLDTPKNLFLSFPQFAWYSLVAVAIKTSETASLTLEQVKENVWAIDAQLPVPRLQSMHERIDHMVGSPRFYSALLTIFAALALVLAAAGIYGTMQYLVGRRRREFGIRLAVGARPGQIMRLVLARGLSLTAVGLTIGLIGALTGAAVLDSLVFEISSTDLPTYGGVILILAGVALAACLLPGRRAAATDPVKTLAAD